MNWSYVMYTQVGQQVARFAMRNVSDAVPADVCR